MRLYKGASPGSHWWTNDAKGAGGFTVARGPRNLNAIVRHIVNYSWPSPYSSFSASFAAASAYALPGATAAVPGYVYEIDVQLALPHVGFIDPAREIVNENPAIGAAGAIPTYHDGGADLILGIADPSRAAVLTSPPRKPHPKNGQHLGPGAPVVHDELRALVFAVRDAEVLATGNVPAACIVHRYPVY